MGTGPKWEVDEVGVYRKGSQYLSALPSYVYLILFNYIYISNSM